ncbi:MAG: hypothetical protein DRP57_06100 [Spirochaetes bacterium]|nr:MAG: hypothetical protein DRP57_06100 [Spirochaetota bacterium]
MHPLLNRERQKKAKDYNTKKHLWSLITAVLEFTVLICALVFHFNIILYKAFYGISPVLEYLIWSAVIAAAAQTVALIPSFISGYFLEKEYGFMKQSIGSWFGDLGKGLFLEIVLAWIVLMLFGWVVKLSGMLWWAVFAFVLFLFQGLLAVIFPVLILPIFHKYNRIEDETLTTKLKSVLDRAGLKVLGFYREDSSKKTAHDNAFFTGLGATRRIVLYDNLIENYTPDEIGAVIGHEAAHRKRNHIVKLMFVNLIETLLISLLIQFFLVRYYPEFFTGGTAVLPALFAVMLIFGAVSAVLQTAANYLSRRFEYEADMGALKYTGNKESLMSMLAKLADRNLSDAYPPKWVKLFFLSHPPVGERIEYVEKSNN